MSDILYSVKMRSSRDAVHISGAERIVERSRVADVARALVRRVKTPFDFMNIKVEAVEAPLRAEALRVVSHEVASPEEGWRVAEEILREAGFSRAQEIRAMFRDTYSMRGAMLLDADSLERLEPDRERGVRATCMDSVPSPSAAAKNHFAEALTLATKVLAAPGIVGEVCVSDDPGYVTGYVATAGCYHRISILKDMGSPLGGRIFLYRGNRQDAQKTVEFLERAPMLVVPREDGQDVPRHPNARVAAARMDSLKRELDDFDSRGLRRTISLRSAEGVNFASNDYLGLADDERVKNAAAKAALEYGAGAGASRFVTGTLEPHITLERHIAAFKGCDDAIVFPTGYMANVGAISALAGRDDVVLSDELNHASIIDGCRLCGAEVQVYRHLDMDDLERRLARCKPFRRRIVVSDGVFSMDGDMLDLPRFVEICRRHDAFSHVDEAHSLGVAGATGHGLAEHFGCDPSALPDINMGTLSKALGSLGGYVAGSAAVVEFIRQKARSFMFSTAPCPAAMAAADAALSIIESDGSRVAALRANVRLFCDTLGIAPVPGAIIPVIIGDERRALAASAELRRMGFIIPAIRYPTVAHGAARLRIAVSAAHSHDEIVKAAQAVANFA